MSAIEDCLFGTIEMAALLLLLLLLYVLMLINVTYLCYLLT